MKKLGTLVRIGPLRLKVETVPLIPDDLRGRMDYCDLRVTIMRMNPDAMFRTFLHEVIHAILDANGQYDEARDETLISGLAHGLAGLLRDNAWVRRFYEKEGK